MSEFALPAYNWKPRADQLPAWSAMTRPDFRYANLCAHRRWGKDEVLLQLIAAKAMERVGTYWHCMPEYGQIRRALWEGVNWRTGRTRIDDAFPSEIVAKRDNETMMLWLESGSTIQLVGSDRVDSLVGAGLAGLGVSEAALTKSEFFAFVQPMLEESGGWRADISTPRGKNHFHHAHLGAQEDMRNGERGVFAAYLPATATPVFKVDQLHRIHRDLIRQHGKTIGDALFKQEYLCDWDAAVIGAVWGAELSQMAMEARIGDFPHDRRFPVFTSWDIGIGDSTVILFWQEIGGRYRLIEAFESNDIGLAAYVAELKRLHAEESYNYGTHYGPHDVEQREWLAGVSRKAEARRMGLEFKRTPQTRVATQIACGAQLINQMVVNKNSAGAMGALERFKGYRYPRNKATGAVVPTPVHDENSHASSALCTFAVNVAASLGMSSAVARDEALHSADTGLGGTNKFDPRELGPAPFSNVPFVRPGAGAPAPRGAFG